MEKRQKKCQMYKEKLSHDLLRSFTAITFSAAASCCRWDEKNKNTKSKEVEDAMK